MALQATHNDTKFGVGDVVNVHQKLTEKTKDGKDRIQIFQGTVIGIKGRNKGKNIVVRKIGSQNVGIELIMPLASPNLEKIEVVKKGQKGVRQSKLYFTREKSKKEIDKIYTRAKRRKEDETQKSK